MTAATGDASPSGVDGKQAAQLANGDWLEYRNVAFGTGSSQFHARVASGAAGGVSGLVEVVLVVEDLERSVRFYRDLLGLEVISPPAATATFLRVGPQHAGLPQQIVLVPRPAEVAPATGRRLHHIGLQVAPENFDAERNRLALAGYALRSGVHPFMPVDAFYLDDPDGNEVEIATWRGEA